MRRERSFRASQILTTLASLRVQFDSATLILRNTTTCVEREREVIATHHISRITIVRIYSETSSCFAPLTRTSQEASSALRIVSNATTTFLDHREDASAAICTRKPTSLCIKVHRTNTIGINAPTLVEFYGEFLAR